jgi:hypothetical protein
MTDVLKPPAALLNPSARFSSMMMRSGILHPD